MIVAPDGIEDRSCLKVCPGEGIDFATIGNEIWEEALENDFIGHYVNIYTGSSKNKDIRFNSSSGGLVTQLLIFALESKLIDGALVTRMSKTSPLEPEPFIATTREEILEASKSKYCPVPVNIALKSIINSELKKIAVVGLPCHIHGIRKAEQINKVLKMKIRLHLGLFCASGKSFLATDFQLKRMHINKMDVANISYRGQGWPGKMTIMSRDGNEVSESYSVYYDNKFASFTPWRCSVCPDEASELADISFGDAWINAIKKNDLLGTSLIISRTVEGDNILKDMYLKNIIILNNANINDVMESQGGFKRKRFIYARSLISKKLLRKKIPLYPDLKSSSRNIFFESIVVTLIYIKDVFAYKPRLWGILAIYCDLLSSLESIRVKK